MKNNKHNYNFFAGRNVEHIQALTDGVFAIALTLLVLDIRVPVNEAINSEAEVISVFYQLLPNFLSYFLSFMMLGILWTGSSAQMSHIEKSDRHFTWLSLFFLMFVSLLPFTTAFLSEHIEFKFAIGVYWLNIFLAGIFIWRRWDYAYKHDFISGTPEEKEEVTIALRNRVITSQSLYAAAALLCFISTYLSIIVIIVIQLNYALAFFYKDNSKTENPA